MMAPPRARPNWIYVEDEGQNLSFEQNFLRQAAEAAPRRDRSGVNIFKF
jgi:hypothetical protein